MPRRSGYSARPSAGLLAAWKTKGAQSTTNSSQPPNTRKTKTPFLLVVEADLDEWPNPPTFLGLESAGDFSGRSSAKAAFSDPSAILGLEEFNPGQSFPIPYTSEIAFSFENTSTEVEAVLNKLKANEFFSNIRKEDLTYADFFQYELRLTSEHLDLIEKIGAIVTGKGAEPFFAHNNVSYPIDMIDIFEHVKSALNTNLFEEDSWKDLKASRVFSFKKDEEQTLHGVILYFISNDLGRSATALQRLESNELANRFVRLDGELPLCVTALSPLSIVTPRTTTILAITAKPTINTNSISPTTLVENMIMVDLPKPLHVATVVDPRTCKITGEYSLLVKTSKWPSDLRIGPKDILLSNLKSTRFAPTVTNFDLMIKEQQNAFWDSRAKRMQEYAAKQVAKRAKNRNLTSNSRPLTTQSADSIGPKRIELSDDEGGAARPPSPMQKKKRQADAQLDSNRLNKHQRPNPGDRGPSPSPSLEVESGEDSATIG